MLGAPLLTPERVRELLDYDPSTGQMTWKAPTAFRMRGGERAGCSGYQGRVRIAVDRHTYPRARLAWCHFYGKWPEKFVDHINCDPSDDRIVNLRDVGAVENRQNLRRAQRDNASSGLLGVTKQAGRLRYRAKLKADGKYIHIGSFATAEEAHAAYVEAKRRFHAGCTL